ncbi:hypothetical protein S1OALGB6SA_1678 [Olavius algarvensis spirochete endosymbiont]|uniref:hypothetical protein n=1 Tax=Olavius algarvensis spirochete endosymbiont TaxID=260710 RepID=UPI00052CD320|nr:hypothetical protein [Olavius algarvensis spirochete endosymbiont]KGM42751.1 hypothetical protein JY97_11800 [Alkalispirochaeta odontotermitis]VDB00596.1 hypothetical protein S1OALGB6SA_1678 [Olavius algarvensis spirochete endosymbiont]
MTSGVEKFRSFLILALLTMPSISALPQNLDFADGLKYNNFYAVRIYRVGGEQLTLFDVASYDGDSSLWPELETDADSSSDNLASDDPTAAELPPIASANTAVLPPRKLEVLLLDSSN